MVASAVNKVIHGFSSCFVFLNFWGFDLRNIATIICEAEGRTRSALVIRCSDKGNYRKFYNLDILGLGYGKKNSL